MKKIYKQSKAHLTIRLFVDLILCTILVGFVTGLMHIIGYLRNTITLAESSVILKKGLLSINTVEIPYSKINSVTVKRGILGSIFGYGNIAILAGNDLEGEVFKGLQSPEQLRTELLAKSK